MVSATIFFRVDDASLFLILGLVILAGGIIAYVDDRRSRRKPHEEQEHPRRAA
jgi:hypothetical protein